MTELERLRIELNQLLLAGHRPTDPLVVAVSQALDRLMVADMTGQPPAGQPVWCMSARLPRQAFSKSPRHNGQPFR